MLRSINTILHIKLKNEKKIFSTIFIMNFIFIFLSYDLLLRNHFSIDSYSSLLSPSSIAETALRLGRVISWLIGQLFSLVQINVVENQTIFTFLSILIMAYVATGWVKSFVALFKDTTVAVYLLTDLAILLSLVNVFILEWYLFPEVVFLFMLGLLATYFSTIFIMRPLKILNIIISLCLLTTAMNLYQINIHFFVMITTTWLLLKSNCKLKLSFLVCLGIALLAGLFNVFSLKLLQRLGMVAISARDVDFSFTQMLENAKMLLTHAQSRVWIDGLGLMPEGICLSFLGILVICLLMQFKSDKRSIADILYCLLACMVNFSIIFVPHVLTRTIWLAPRTMVGAFVFLTTLALMILYFKPNMRRIIVYCAGLFIMLCINFYQIHDISLNHLMSNAIDKHYANIIVSQIKKYEQKSGIKVTKIASCRDDSPMYGHYDVVKYVSFDINIRAYIVDYANVNALNYYTHNNFVKIAMDDEIYKKYFLGKNWYYFDAAEQMIFVNDTLYIAMY